VAPLVSVIVPYRNGRLTDLPRLFAALRRQTISIDDYEIIAVDNNIKPCIETLKLAKSNEVIWIHQAAMGSYSARNAGAAIATGEILAFTDADCIPNERWLEELVTQLRTNGDEAIVAGTILLTSKSCWKNLYENYDRIMHHRQDYYVASGFGATANLSMYRALFEKVGPFDEAFLSGGDRDWCERACHIGSSISLSVDASVTHPTRASFGEHVTKNRRGVGGDASGIRKQGLGIAAIAVSQLLNTSTRLRILRHATRGHPICRRLQLLCVFFLLQVVRIAESLRLACGTAPERR
jgi:glycosyltransferase involved in cell wall biosynthesis